ncbi:hypothetical protein [Ralstonia pseudosolanacearum]
MRAKRASFYTKWLRAWEMPYVREHIIDNETVYEGSEVKGSEKE